MREEGRASSFPGRRPRRSGRLLLPFPTLIASASIMFGAACGIESGAYEYLPPILIPSGNTLQLAHVSDNSLPNFQGYELYYRAYDDRADAESARSAIDSFVQASPEICISRMVNEYGYHLAAGLDPVEDTARLAPLFLVDPLEWDKSVIFLIVMSSESDWTVTKYVDNEEADSFRLVRDKEGDSSFATLNFIPLDVDYKTRAEGPVGPHPGAIVFFGLATALKMDSFLTSHSVPRSPGAALDVP